MSSNIQLILLGTTIISAFFTVEGGDLEIRELWLSEDEKDYYGASLACQIVGAEMFFPKSEKDAKTVIDKYFGDNVEDIWIGVRDDFGSGTLKTVDGSKLFYADWAEGQPEYGDFVSPSAIVRRDSKYELREAFGSKRRYICSNRKKPCKRSADYSEYDFLGDQKAAYRFHESRVVPVASLICATEGGEMFYPRSPEEMRVVFERIVDPREDEITIGMVKVSGEFNTIDGAYICVPNAMRPFTAKWILRKVIEGLNWLPGHPKSDGEWVTLYRNGSHGSRLQMYGNFVCKRAMDEECQGQDYGPMYVEYMDQVFKYRAEKMTHYEAEAACKKEGGSLAMPSNRWATSEILRAFYSRGHLFDPNVWLGFYTPKKDFYVTVKGSTLNTLPYDWANVDHKNQQGCVALTDKEKLDVISCDQKRALLCQYGQDAVKTVQYHGRSAKKIVKIKPLKKTKQHSVDEGQKPLADGQEGDLSTHSAEFMTTTKLAPVPLSWYEAVAYCDMKNTVLAYPDTRESRKIMTNALDAFHVDQMFVGFQNLMGYEEPTQLKDYTKVDDYFFYKKPKPEEKVCGGLENDGLIGLDCDTPRRFMCEEKKQ